MDNKSQFTIYKSADNQTKIAVRFEEETVWLTQADLAELFKTTKQNISLHIKNIFTEKELSPIGTVKEFLTVRQEGERQVNRKLEYYNLDVIISVGYRVKSSIATAFRQWATTQLKDYIIKGFVLDDDRLKQGSNFGKDYFQELLERVRSIRASERRIYQKVTDIFAECSIDYDPNSDICKNFYAIIQNKFHFAITGHTAAEIIYSKADCKNPNMGLTTWKNSPKGRVLKSDTNIAKNYLEAEEIKKLERTISSYFDYIERLIENQNKFTMEQLAESVNKFLEFNEYKVLDHKGKVSHQDAEEKAFAEYEEFNKKQMIDSDFDRFVKKILK